MLTRAVAYQSVMSLGNAVALLAGHRAIVSDTFTRADSATTLGNAETGQAWTALTGTWGITSDTAYLAVNAAVDNYAIIDSGIADGQVEAVFSTFATIQFLVARCTDANDAIVVSAQNASTINLYRRQAGAYTQIGTAAHTWASGDRVTLIMRGSSLTVLVNGVVLITATETFNQTATKHGLAAGSSGTAWAWDNFKVTAP